MAFLQFTNKLVPYEVFLRDFSKRVALELNEIKNDPEYVSQRKAYSMFGRANIERWRRSGLVNSYRRPGKVEYKTYDLRLLQLREQDYLVYQKI